MQVIPLTAQPSQIFNVTINSASWRIAVYEKKGYADDGTPSPRLYCDFTLGGVLLVAGALASVGVPLLRHTYLTPGSTQDFFFTDTKGTDAPISSGLGDRWLLMAFDVTDL